MPGRDWRFRLADMEEYAERALSYTQGLTFGQFEADRMRVDAVLRVLEILGEAARSVPEEARSRTSGVPWTEIIAMRNLLAHAYLRVDLEVVWDTVRRDLPELLRVLRDFRSGRKDVEP